MFTRFATIAALALLAGCASTGTDVKPTALHAFEAGRTTEAQVEQALGPPQFAQTAPDGTRTVLYIGSHAQIKASSFIPVVGLFAGGAKMQSTSVTFHFDPDGKLLNYQSGSGQTDVRSGLIAGAQ